MERVLVICTVEWKLCFINLPTDLQEGDCSFCPGCKEPINLFDMIQELPA